MIYVMDSGPLITMFRYYYPETFETLWQRFDEMRQAERILSVREVSMELDGRDDRLSKWVRDNKAFFHSPTAREMQFVAEIFKVPHFQTIVKQQERLQGKPVADPFVIAKAREYEDGCVVTAERHKPNAAKIPNVCDHFGIKHIDLEKFMVEEKWKF